LNTDQEIYLVKTKFGQSVIATTPNVGIPTGVSMATSTGTINTNETKQKLTELHCQNCYQQFSIIDRNTNKNGTICKSR
jgi:hypothetical protein